MALRTEGFRVHVREEGAAAAIDPERDLVAREPYGPAPAAIPVHWDEGLRSLHFDRRRTRISRAYRGRRGHPGESFALGDAFCAMHESMVIF